MDRFQSASTEQAYRVTALNARALNVLLFLSAYQAELLEDYTEVQDPAIMKEIPVISDLCLQIPCTDINIPELASDGMASGD